jgi:hypothetical protein
MGSAYDAINGTGWAAGRKHENLRALFPMYETSFQVAALRNSAIGSLGDLDGKKVGVGPAKGPAEGFFRAAAEVAHSQAGHCQRRSGGAFKNGDRRRDRRAMAGRRGADSVAERSRRSGRCNCIWALRRRGCRDAAEIPAAGSAPTIPAGTYQAARAPTSEASRRGISWSPTRICPSIRPTRSPRPCCRRPIRNPRFIPPPPARSPATRRMNRFLPFHPGAMRFYAEAGIKLPSP